MDTEKHETCEHCGAMVGEDGLALDIHDEPDPKEPEAKEAKDGDFGRSFADAVAARKRDS